MRKALAVSVLFHVAVLLVAWLGMPFMDRPPLEMAQPVPVEVVEAAPMTTADAPPVDTPAPKEKPKEEPTTARTPPQSSSAPPPPLPTPTTPAPPDVAPPEVALDVPDAPEPTTEPTPLPDAPAPEPEPEPEPAPLPTPEPAPEPEPEPAPADVAEPAPVAPAEAPRRKPKPPAQVAEAKPEPKPEPEPEEKPADTDFSSLLKNLAKGDAPQDPEKTPDRKNAEPPPPSPPAPIAAKLSGPEVDAVRRAISRCWNVDPGARGIQDFVVEIVGEIGPDGVVIDARVSAADQFKMGDQAYRAFAEGAARAMRNTACQPLPLPLDKYDQWRTFAIRFSPQGML